MDSEGAATRSRAGAVGGVAFTWGSNFSPSCLRDDDEGDDDGDRRRQDRDHASQGPDKLLVPVKMARMKDVQRVSRQVPIAENNNTGSTFV